MGFYKSVYRCNVCKFEWNSFFCSVDMSSGATACPQCKSENKKLIGDQWGNKLNILDWDEEDTTTA